MSNNNDEREFQKRLTQLQLFITELYAAAGFLITLGGVALAFIPVVEDVSLKCIYFIIAAVLLIIGTGLFIVGMYMRKNMNNWMLQNRN